MKSITLIFLSISLISGFYSSAFVKANATGSIDNPILRWDGTNFHIENTVQGAIDNASSGEAILLKDGTYVEDILLNKPDISIIGSGSGQWTGTTYKGGTIIKGAFVWGREGLNCKLKSVGLTPNNPSNSTAYNLSFMGGYSVANINFNCYIDDVAFYGDGFCAHNTEFRGKKWFVTNVRSYNAGIHNFPIKAADSVFRNIYVDNNGVNNSSCIIFKSHLTGNGIGTTYGSPNNTVIDGFEVVTSGSSSYGGFLIANNNQTNESINNLIIRNGFINNLQAGNAPCLRCQGRVQSSNIIKNVTIDNVVFKGGQVGIRFENGQSTTSGQGVEGVYIRNCTFIEPAGTESGRYAINNNFGGSPAFGVTVGNITVRDYPYNQVVNVSNAANASVQQGSIFVIRLISDTVFQTAVDINDTVTVENGTISEVVAGAREFISSSTAGIKKIEFGDYPSATLDIGDTYRVSYEAYSPEGTGTANIFFGGKMVISSQTFGAGRLDYVSNEFTLTAGQGMTGSYVPNTEGLEFYIYNSSSSGLSDGESLFIKNLKIQVPADTDGDGLSDGDEIYNYGSNPLLSDTDQDGFSDDKEILFGLDISSSDTDIITHIEQMMRDLRIGSQTFGVSNGNAKIRMFVDESSDLTSTWSNTQHVLELDIPADADTKFYRFRMD